jgi:hypothetical protein
MDVDRDEERNATRRGAMRADRPPVCRPRNWAKGRAASPGQPPAGGPLLTAADLAELGRRRAKPKAEGGPT